MKKIGTFILIICLFQLSVFVPNKLVWAAENTDEANVTDDIMNFYDTNDENYNDELGFSSNGRIWDFRCLCCSDTIYIT